MLRNAKTRAIVIQVFGVSLVALVVLFACITAWRSMNQQGFAYGFDILFKPTGWTLESPFLTQATDDPYWRTLLVALVNTAVVGIVSIFISGIVGLLLGVALTAQNKVLATVSTIYVEVFRNVPLVLQVVFWYVTFTQLPNPRADPPSIFGAAFLSNKGFAIPWLGLGPDTGPLWVGIILIVALLVTGSRILKRRHPQIRLPSRRSYFLALGIALVAYVALFTSPNLSIPHLQGFNFQGGWTVPLEFLALTFAIVIFSSAYVAEIVRGGLKSVPSGQIEAAQSLGLRPTATFIKVRFPIALRSMIPPLGNQFIFVMKATSLGIAVGYSDLFSASMVSISQTGQSIEFLVVMMAAYFILNYAMTLIMHWLNAAIAFKGVGR